jgi:cytoskeleton protein RodZ
LPSFGQKLKAEREKRSITLDQISLTTKIGTRMLQALEDDKFSQLPGGIFNKGFVRAYARCVGIDEDQAVSDYLEAAGESAPPSTEAETETSTRTSPHKSSLSRVPTLDAEPSSGSRELPWGLFAALLLVIALALSVWTHQKRDARAVSTPVVTPSASQSPAPSGSGMPANTTNAVNAKPPQTNAAEKANPRPTISTEKKIEGGPQASPGAMTPNLQSSAPQSGQFTVLIQAREDSWVSITADGKTIASYLLSAGEQRAVHGRQSVIIKAGNAGGLDVLFNGQKVGPQGASGEVKTLIFGPAGLDASSTAPESRE